MVWTTNIVSNIVLSGGHWHQSCLRIYVDELKPGFRILPVRYPRLRTLYDIWKGDCYNIVIDPGTWPSESNWLQVCMDLYATAA